MKDYNSLTDDELLKKYEEELVLLQGGWKTSERDLDKMFAITQQRGLDIGDACQGAIDRYYSILKHATSNAMVMKYGVLRENEYVYQTKKVDKGTPVFSVNYNPAIATVRKLLSRAENLMYFTVSGNSMINARLNDGDIVLIDMKKKPKKYHIVAATINGDYYVKRYMPEETRIVLQSENEEYDDIVITEYMHFNIVGVVAGKLDLSIG